MRTRKHGFNLKSVSLFEIFLCGVYFTTRQGRLYLSILKYCVLSGRGLYGGPIPHPEQSYRVCVCVCVFFIQCDQMQR